jgi:hypothetical protein
MRGQARNIFEITDESWGEPDLAPTTDLPNEADLFREAQLGRQVEAGAAGVFESLKRALLLSHFRSPGSGALAAALLFGVVAFGIAVVGKRGAERPGSSRLEPSLRNDVRPKRRYLNESAPSSRNVRRPPALRSSRTPVAESSERGSIARGRAVPSRGSRGRALNPSRFGRARPPIPLPPTGGSANEFSFER